MQAEAYIQLGEQDKALPLINQIRNRAAKSTGRLKNLMDRLLQIIIPNPTRVTIGPRILHSKHFSGRDA